MSPEPVMNLIVVAHPDDEILGFGATGAKFVHRGEAVQAVILCGHAGARSMRPTDDELSQDMLKANELVGFGVPVVGDFPNLRMNNVDHINLVEFIEAQIRVYQPARIFTHHPNDLNDDHCQVSRACLAAARLFQRREDVAPLKTLSFLEILSSTDWKFPGQGGAFEPNTYEDVSDFMALKISSLKCYRNVVRGSPHPRSETVVRGLASFRGGHCGATFAEAFQTVFRVGI